MRHRCLTAGDTLQENVNTLASDANPSSDRVVEFSFAYLVLEILAFSHVAGCCECHFIVCEVGSRKEIL